MKAKRLPNNPTGQNSFREPPVTAETPYDLFISYADADRAWVEGYLLDALQQASIHYHSVQAFHLGAPLLEEFERAIQQSKRVLLVLTPAYLAQNVDRFVTLLAQHYGLESGAWPVIPLLLQDVQLPARLGVLVPLDAREPMNWDAVVARLCQTLKASPPIRLSKPPCPYPGMTPFREEESEFFFGRTADIEMLLHKLRQHPFITVIGPSGSGKSSLIFAGLIPALRQSTLFGPGTWLVRTVRPGVQPATALNQALGVTAFNQFDLKTFLAAEPGTTKLLLIIDQFEELFTQESAEKALFLQNIQTLITLTGCYVVMTVRADFYADLMTSKLWREIEAHRLDVVPLDEEGLREAIVRPAERRQVYIESALVERLVANAAGEPGVLPFVQEVLVLLWEKIERRYLPLRAYEALVLPYKALSGEERTGLQVAMAQKADAKFSELTAEQQRIARRIFLRLVQFGEGHRDIRRQQPISALRSAGEDGCLFDATLQQLAQNRLLTITSNIQGEPLVDLSHEAMIKGWPLLQAWVKEHGNAELMRRRLELKAEEWVRLGQGVGGLLDPVELREFQTWQQSVAALDIGFSDQASDLIHMSERAIAKATHDRQRGRQLVRILVWTAVSIILLFGGIGLIFNWPVITGWQIVPLPQGITATEFQGLTIETDQKNPDLLYLLYRPTGSLFKSVNGGRTWSALELHQSKALPLQDIAVTSRFVYVTSSRYLYVSDNYGESWHEIQSPSVVLPDQKASVIASDLGNPLNIFWGFQDGSLYTTTDGGLTWRQNASTILDHAITSLAVSGADVVASTGDTLWISKDSGKSWQRFVGNPMLPGGIVDLTMPSRRGRFLLALGKAGIGDGDVSSEQWFRLSNPPPVTDVRAITASNNDIYLISEQGLWCYRLWEWTQQQWWRARLGMSVPCVQ
jgi:hypothetical protein